jgi:hypothetical protein
MRRHHRANSESGNAADYERRIPLSVPSASNRLSTRPGNRDEHDASDHHRSRRSCERRHVAPIKVEEDI